MGLPIGISPNWDVEATMALYADAACTQIFENADTNADLTVYVQWSE